MIRINSRTKTEGELLVRRMSDKAQEYYYGTDLVTICADDRGDDEGIEVSYDRGQTWKTVTFADLEAAFEELRDEELKTLIYVADKETGTFIEEVFSIEEGLERIEELEEEDREDGTYVEGFYDLVDGLHCTIER